MRKTCLILLCILICWTLITPVAAAEWDEEFNEKLILDNGNVFSGKEEGGMQWKLAKVSREFKTYLYILTEATIGEQDPKAYAEKYFISQNLGCGENRNGVMLFLCMDRQKWVIYANGLGDQAVSEEDVQAIGDKIRPELVEGDFVQAVSIFEKECMRYLEEEVNREKYPVHEGIKTAIFFCATAALIVTGIVRSVKKRAWNVHKHPKS